MPTAVDTAIVTKDELLELAESERAYAKAKKKLSDAERDVKLRRMQLVEKILGLKTEDELKKLSPAKVQQLSAKRLTAGHWEPGRGAPAFAFAKTSEGRYPAWAQLYATELGESAAAEIRSDTPVSYSYAVEVAEPAV